MLVKAEKSEQPSIRRSQRVLARIRLSVSGKIGEQPPFEEECFTIAVSAEGGLLQMRKAVQKGQRLSLLQARTGQQSLCVVVHVEPYEGGFAAVRVQFIEPQPDFWHITFPPGDWSARHADSKFKKQPQMQLRAMANA
jgi:hypothetical protein